MNAGFQPDITVCNIIDCGVAVTSKYSEDEAVSFCKCLFMVLVLFLFTKVFKLAASASSSNIVKHNPVLSWYVINRFPHFRNTLAFFLRTMTIGLMRLCGLNNTTSLSDSTVNDVKALFTLLYVCLCKSMLSVVRSRNIR